MESQALALREEPTATVPALIPTEAEFVALARMAHAIHATQMVPKAYRGHENDVLAAMMTGREMGLGPMQSLREIYVIDGKPSLAANLLLARMRSGGLIIEESESTADRAWARVRNRATGEVVEEEWTMDEARVVQTRENGRTISLSEKNTFRNYPKDMLWARLIGRIARRFPDLIGAVMPYTSEEVQDWEDAPADSGDRGSFGSDTKTGEWHGPKDWAELSQRVVAQLGEDAAAWMEELAEKAYAHPDLASVLKDAEVPEDRKRDLWTRLNVVLRGLEDAGDLAFTVGVRQIIGKIFYDAFDQQVTLQGPDWALDPEEAKKMPQRDGTPPPDATGSDLPAESESATDPSPEAAETATDEGDAPSDASETNGGDDLDGIKF